MSIVTRTIYGATLLSELLLGLPHVHVANTTLNERFDVFPNVTPSNGQMPTLHYLGIGVGGHRHMVGAENQPYNDPIEHDPADAAAYRPIPFILREVGDDLSPAERQRYAMRRLETYNGVNYIAYYLRRLSLDQVRPVMTINVPQESTGTTKPVIKQDPFVPTGANLNPTAPAIPPGSTISTDGSYLSASAVLNVSLSEQEVEEILNVARIKWGNEKLAVVSEMQLVAGVDQVMSSTIGGSQVNYIEAIEAIVCAHLTSDLPLASLTKGVNHALELGAIEPLRVITAP